MNSQMNDSCSVLTTGFNQLALEISCNNRQVFNLAEFLFRDFPDATDAVQITQCQFCTLTYGSFDDIESIFCSVHPFSVHPFSS